MEERLINILQRDTLDLQVEFLAPSETGGSERRRVRSPDPAEEKFNTALQGMKPHLLTLLNLPEKYATGLTIIGVMLKWDEDLAEVQILAKKEIAGLKDWKIRTPATYFTGKASESLSLLCELAIAYAKGERAQLEMVFEGEESEAEKPKSRPRRSKFSRSMTQGVS